MKPAGKIIPLTPDGPPTVGCVILPPPHAPLVQTAPPQGPLVQRNHALMPPLCKGGCPVRTLGGGIAAPGFRIPPGPCPSPRNAPIIPRSPQSVVTQICNTLTMICPENIRYFPQNTVIHRSNQRKIFSHHVTRCNIHFSPVPSAILAGTGLPDGPNGITSVLLVGAISDRPLTPRNAPIIPHLPVAVVAKICNIQPIITSRNVGKTT